MGDEIYFEKLMTWFKKENPEMYETYKANIDFTDGKVSVNGNNGLSDLDREIVIRMLDQHPPFE